MWLGGDMDWIEQAQDRDRWRTLVTVVMTPYTLIKFRCVLTYPPHINCAIVSWFWAYDKVLSEGRAISATISRRLLIIIYGICVCCWYVKDIM